jgi:hypothetical protein
MKSPLDGTVEAAIRTAMTPDPAIGADPRLAAAVLADLYHALASHLEPLVGTAGVRAIYGRSVPLATSERCRCGNPRGRRRGDVHGRGEGC